MKKLLLLFLLFCMVHANGQNPTYQQKLFYTCKIWGFVKYFHSGVSTCSVDWDGILVSRLPYIKAALTNEDFNNELVTLLNAAGPMTIASGTLPDNIPPELKRNLDFLWFNNPIIRNDVKVILDTIKNNFRPHSNCWVKNNDYTNSYTGWLVFPHDSLMVNIDTYDSFPDEYTRLLMAFKYWNILHYFNPYNYVLDTPGDSMLYNKILLVANAADYKAFYFAIKTMAKDLNDAHAEGLTWSTHVALRNSYAPPIVLTYTQQKYIVAKSAFSNVKRGDEIISINGLSAKNMEDSLRPYISAGDSSVFHRFMCNYILNGQPGTTISLDYADSLGNNHTLSTTRTDYVYGSFFSYYPNDSLALVKWKKFGCNVGYVNMGQLQQGDVDAMYSSLSSCSAIIFDIRNYPNETAWAIATKMYPYSKMFCKIMEPDVTYPGLFSWYDDYCGLYASHPYTGKVIILMNEQTQSQAEFSCMILENMEHSIKIGSQTAGADGNITSFRLSKDMPAGFTNLGIFYPNGDSTQRIGIRPDILVYPTPMGIRHRRDEVLEKALQISDCTTSVHILNDADPTIKVYPNPTKGLFFIETNSTEKQTIDLFDINGRHVFSKNINGNAQIDVTNFKNGVYTLNIRSVSGNINQKLIIIH
jgi:C-terminal processing protease CtpA/Prc